MRNEGSIVPPEWMEYSEEKYWLDEGYRAAEAMTRRSAGDVVLSDAPVAALTRMIEKEDISTRARPARCLNPMECLAMHSPAQEAESRAESKRQKEKRQSTVEREDEHRREKHRTDKRRKERRCTDKQHKTKCCTEKHRKEGQRRTDTTHKE